MALTFHGAGSVAIAAQILAEAERAGAAVTVLAVGSWLEQEPAMAARIVDGGHDLGNHTWSHRPMRRLSAATAREEVARCDAVLRRLVGAPGRWFRPSGTPTSTPAIRAAAARAGYPFCLSYDVDSLDYTDPGSAAVVRNTLRGVRKGSIVSLHLGHQGTVRALPQIIDGLRTRRLEPVTVTQLLA